MKILNLFKSSQQIKTPKEVEFDVLQKYNATFVTTDKIEHTSVEYNYANSSQLNCPVGDYIMISINSDKYIKDENRVIYPLTNVVSIKWNLVDEVKIPSKLFNHGMMCNVFYNKDDLNDLLAKI